MALKFLNNGYFAGKVGIGIESPTTLLHLDQSSNDRAGGLYIERNASNYGLSMFVNSGGYGIIGSNGTFTKDILTLDLSSGNVGIGTTSPSTKLDVVGNVVIATTGVTDNLLLTSVDTSAASAPDLVLFRNAAIADNDTLGVVEYKGKNGMVPSSSTPFLYNAIYSRINDASNNHSSLSFHANKGNGTGAYVDAVHISAIGTNNSAAGALLINPSSDFELPAYNLDVKGTGNFTGLVSGITPVAAANFVTKAYVDGGGGAGSGFLPLSAGSSYPLSGVLYAGQGVKFTGGTIAAATTVLHTNNVVYARGGSGGMFLQNADGSDGMFIANDHVRIETGSSERIRIIANGNVGIGTTTPTAKLDVRLSTATGKVAELHNNAGYGVGFTVESDGGVNTINSESNQALAFATNGASNERMRITTGGDVGIGTTSPDANLEVVGTTVISTVTDGVNAVLIGLAGSNRTTIQFDTADTTHTNRQWGLTNIAGDFYVGRHGLNVMTMKNNGNVGIGTNSPGAKLDIRGSGGYLRFDTSNSNGSIKSDFNLQLYADPEDDNSSGYQNIQFFTAGTSEKMRIDYSGRVGIGTTSPSAKLQVSGEAYVTGQFGQGVAIANKIATYGAEFRTSGASAQIFFGRSGSGVGSGAIGADSTYVFRVWTIPGFGNPFVIKQDGNVGIGTTSPTAKLHVAGTGLFTGLVSGITPVAAANFVTKAYVDGSGGGTGPFLPLAGGTMHWY